jgi:transcriptional regulator with XRE-family HTH domain
MTETSANQFAAAEVRAELARQRISQRDLAARLDPPQNQMYLQRRLSGRVGFDVDDLAAIAAALAVPVTQFLPPDGVRTPG